jgi:hypothetical protein
MRAAYRVFVMLRCLGLFLRLGLLAQLAVAQTSVNVALHSNGAVATASSVYAGAPLGTSVHDGDRRGLGQNYWSDNALFQFPDWVQINFSTTQIIGDIDAHKEAI